ncbi:MAG: uracil-DNA glycosylase [Bacillus sp. (in: firmicutes)]
MILPGNIHASWKPLLTEEVQGELRFIESQLGAEYNPSDKGKILRFLSVDLSKVKVIWLGQDVYPMKGAATGRAFEVGGLDNWNTKFRQVSLKNILRLLHKEYYQIDDYEEIRPYSTIKQEIGSGAFPIKQPDLWFSELEKQGVLFLNTSFTCRTGVPNSHKHLWSRFSQRVLAYIASVRPDCIWFLWGKEAIGMKAYIHKGVFYESRHPMMCSKKYEDDFLKFIGFRETWQEIDWLCKES